MTQEAQARVLAWVASGGRVIVALDAASDKSEGHDVGAGHPFAVNRDLAFADGVIGLPEVVAQPKVRTARPKPNARLKVVARPCESRRCTR